MLKIKPEQTAEAIDAVLSQLRAEDADLRRRAVYTLGNFPGEMNAERVLAMLADPNRGVREAAGEIVAQLPITYTGSYLVGLVGHPHIEIRNLAAKILMEIGSPAIPELMAGFTGSNGDVRKFIVDILGVVGDPGPAPELADSLFSDPDDNVVISTVEALGHMGAPSTVEPLIRLYHERPELRMCVIEALGSIAVPESAAFLMNLVPELTDPLMLMTLVDALGNTGDPQAIATLTELFGRFGKILDAKVVQALFTLGTRAGVNIMGECSEAYITAILTGLEAENDTLCTLIGNQVEAFPDTPCIATLLSHSELLPISLLEKITAAAYGNESLAPHLIPLIFHPDERISISALELVGLHIPARDLLQPLSRLLLNPATDPDMLVAAIQVAGNRELTSLAAVIEKLKNHREYEVIRLAEQASQYLNSLTQANGTSES